MQQQEEQEELYLSKMGSPVYGSPAVEGVLHGEVRRVRGSLEERAQGADVSIPARPVEREAAGEDLLARKARLHSDRHGSEQNDNGAR